MGLSMDKKKEQATASERSRRAPLPKKLRLDEALLKRGLAADAKSAAALIMAGEVLVNGQVQVKAFCTVAAADAVTIQKKHPYVSRGALKLAKAIGAFAVVVPGLKILDLGISTGGFSDYLLQGGAAVVFGVDVNISQVDYVLRQDPRLQLLKKNVRFLRREDIPFAPDLIVMDLSFISITMVLPVLSMFANARIMALVKPQFEAAKGRVGRGGVIRDPEDRREILLQLKKRVEGMGFSLCGFTPAGVKGKKGNQEYFFLLEFGKKKSIDDTMVSDAAEI